jgi:tRNA(Ile)-lysidine synthase
MLNKVQHFLSEHAMIQPGDTVICAVSGGADSMALLWSMYLLKEKLAIRLRAAHFNHQLRGEESNRDESFVRVFCQRFDIPLDVGSAAVTTGEKGLEAAARQARYAFFATLPGKVATAHTANDNAETVLMHLIRGTGLKGLGGIAPVRDALIRPMLSVTRQDVLTFLEEYHIPYVEDSSNREDEFLRNRLRHHVMPLLEGENPCLAENLSAMAQRLRQDEAYLAGEAEKYADADVSTLRSMDRALRGRVLERFLKINGVREPEAEHISLAEALVFSEKPSAKGDFPGGIVIGRCYGRLVRLEQTQALPTRKLSYPGSLDLPEARLRVICGMEDGDPDAFRVLPKGDMVVRCRMPGDEIVRPGGTKSLKKLFIDEKIPADRRHIIPVIADEKGVLAVYGFGANQDRLTDTPAGVWIRFEAL